MKSAKQFQLEAMLAFREKVVEWTRNSEGPVMFPDILDIERKLSDLAQIGRYVIVDFTETSHFDNFSRVYRSGDCLYIAWYENENRFMNGKGSSYLKFRPSRMMVNSNPELRRNHIVIETLAIDQLPRNDDVTAQDDEGMQRVIDFGRELKPLEIGEYCHVFAVMCTPGRVVLHPKGSMLSEEYRGHYFKGKS